MFWNIYKSVTGWYYRQPPKPKTSNVYIIKQNTTPPVFKIGKANNVEKRMKTLQTGNPDVLSIETIIPSVIPFDLESALHKYFVNFRIRKTEWFNITQFHVNTIKKFAEPLSTLDDIISFIGKIDEEVKKCGLLTSWVFMYAEKKGLLKGPSDDDITA